MSLYESNKLQQLYDKRTQIEDEIYEKGDTLERVDKLFQVTMEISKLENKCKGTK